MWVFAILALSLLVACAAPATPAPKPTEPAKVPPTAAPTEAPKPVTIIWGFWGSPEEKASHEKVAAEFEKTHPNIKIKVFNEPWNNYFDKVNTLWAGGDPESIPDVLFLWPTPSYAAKGVLENLEPWIKKSGIDVKDYWPFLLDSARYKGDIYGFPRDISTEVLYYNKKLFTEAGVSFPTENWTWDDFLAAAEKLTKKDAGGRVTQYALGMEGGKWLLWVNQAGGQVLDDLVNPSKCTLDTPEAMKGIKWFADLMNNGYAMRSATLDRQGGDASVFQTGQVAMIIQNSSRVSAFNQANMDYDVAPVPIPKGGQRASINGGAAWVMSARSNKKEAAWTFLSWLQSKGGGQTLYTRTGEIFPALQSVASSDDFMGLGKPANRKAFLIEAGGARPGRFGYFPGWDELEGSILNAQMDRIWAGEAKPEDVVPALCQQVNKWLADNGFPKK
jgi:ABC-type glycerol-3-phosphate transport system substrate-binding protein